MESRAASLFRRCLTRPPTAEELNLLVQSYETQKKRFTSKELDAAAVAGPGDGDPCERGTWMVLARARA